MADSTIGIDYFCGGITVCDLTIAFFEAGLVFSSSEDDSSDDDTLTDFFVFFFLSLFFFALSTPLKILALFSYLSYSALIFTTSIFEVTLPVPDSPIYLYLNFSSGYCVLF